MALFNQTNSSKDTSFYITRNEVLFAFSTLAGDLSGTNLSTLFANPNPSFSTINMPPTGSIQAPFSLTTQKVALSTTGAFVVGNVFGTGTAQNLCVVDPTGVATGNLVAKAFVGTNGNVGGVNAAKIFFSANGIQALDSTSINKDLALYLPNNAVGQNWALSNVSSINGNPPTGGTTFNTLTGNSLTTAVLAATQVVGVSSLNGFPYQGPFSTGYSQGLTTVTLPSGTPILAFSITLPAAYLKPNTTYLYDVPVQFTSWPSTPTGMNLFIGLRLGGNGQINFQIPLYIVSTSQGITLSLTGIAQTNSTSVSTNTIDIILVQSSGSTFTPAVQSPTSAGGVNVYTIKPLS